MHDKNMTQKVYITGEISFLNGYFLTLLPRAVFRAQPKVEVFLQK